MTHLVQVVRSRDRGAAAVEFALVVPILLALMLGIVDYGLWFGDSLSVRQGVREGARQAAVDDLASTPGCTTGSDMEKAACITKLRIGAMGGETYVYASVLTPAGTPTTEWKKGNQILICAMVQEQGLTGVTPMPSDAIIASSVRMRIENGVATRTAHVDTPPAGSDWSWCA